MTVQAQRDTVRPDSCHLVAAAGHATIKPSCLLPVVGHKPYSVGHVRTSTDRGERGVVDEGVFLEDLDLTSVTSREELAEFLRTLYVRADSPSYRALSVWADKHHKPALPKTTVGDILRGRFPRKEKMLVFIEACGVPAGELKPWRQAWERIAAEERRRSEAETTDLERQRKTVLEDAEARAAELIQQAHANARQLITEAERQVSALQSQLMDDLKSLADSKRDAQQQLQGLLWQFENVIHTKPSLQELQIKWFYESLRHVVDSWRDEPTPVVPLDGAWAVFNREILDRLSSAPNFFLRDRAEHRRYVQVEWGGDCIHAETPNSHVPERASEEIPLTRSDAQVLAVAGWNPPFPDAGQLNWWVNLPHTSAESMAAMAVTALRDVQKVQNTAALEFWHDPGPDQSIGPIDTHGAGNLPDPDAPTGGDDPPETNDEQPVDAARIDNPRPLAPLSPLSGLAPLSPKCDSGLGGADAGGQG
jgi:hypothetical protein